jgi:hypothetical protein
MILYFDKFVKREAKKTQWTIWQTSRKREDLYMLQNVGTAVSEKTGSE